MGFGRVLFAVAERGVDAALRRDGVAARRRHFGYAGNAYPVLTGGYGGAQTRPVTGNRATTY